jgi:hypothetical protein
MPLTTPASEPESPIELDSGFFVDEEVLVHHARNRHFERAVIVDEAGVEQLRIRYAGTSFAIVVPLRSVFHDTPAAHTWLGLEYIPGGGTVGNPVHSALEAAREALWDDNPHLDQRAA